MSLGLTAVIPKDVLLFQQVSSCIKRPGELPVAIPRAFRFESVEPFHSGELR